MKKYILLVVAMVFCCTNIFAAEQKAVSAPAAPAAKVESAPAQMAATVTTAPAAPAAPAAPTAQAEAPKKPTRAEMIARINEILTNRPNIAATIQGLESVKTEAGAAYYTFNKKKIEELDDETLLKLLSMINQQLSLENLAQFDRQQRQLRNLKQIEQINKTQKMLRPTPTTSAPKVYTPPKVPKSYK